VKPTAFKIRPYQEDAIRAIVREWQNGVQDTLLVMATGAGKTVVFLGLLAQVLEPGKRALILAHRKELIEQPVDRMRQFYPDLAERVGIVMAEQNDAAADIIVATVQTLASPLRMAEVLGHGPIDYIITDEAHHAPADTYGAVYQMVRDYNPDARHVGVTATPMRTDDRAMRSVFQTVAAKYGIRELVSMGYLVPPRWLAIQTGISVKGVAASGGDFVQKQLANVFETDNCFELVVESHQKFAPGRKFIAFTVSVDGAYRLAEEFQRHGIKAVAADGSTPKAERAQLLADFRAGHYDGLVNCALWAEGLDVPEIALVHHVAPTKSDGLYTQRIGRALRPVPGKEDGLVLDYCPAETRNIAMLGDVLGVEAKREHIVEQDAEPGEVIGGFTFDGKETKWLNGSPMELISRKLDYLNASPFVWSTGGDKHGYTSLGLGEGSDGLQRTLVLAPVAAQMTLWMVVEDKETRRASVYTAMTGSLEELTTWAEGYASERGNAMLAQKAKAWRSQPASEGQIKFASRLKVWQPSMTKGACAEAITHALALRALKREGLVK